MKREAFQNIDFSHVRIVGAGLIGTSIALGLAQRGVTVEIHDDNQETLNLAKDLLQPHIGNRIPEIVVIAVPPERTLEVLKLEYERNHQATFIDVASVKNKLIHNVDTLSGLADRFVGSHPMAGREVSGPSSAQADLFAGRAWILTPTSRSSQESIELAQQLVALLGATSYIMQADHHDELLAKISHLPQLLSTSLASSLVGLDDELALAGQGLRDMTRIANSDADLWSQIIMDNKDAVLRALRSFEEKFKSLTDSIAIGDEVTLQRIFREGNVGRSKVSGKHGSQPRNYAYLLVVIQDEPGALSRLFLECAEISANIEDLSIEHSPGQLTGLITLAFSPEDAQRVQTHLTKKRLEGSFAMTIVVAMDGPSGSGKSSTSKAIAKRAGWLYLDTGALYRAVTWLAIKETIDDAPSLVSALEKFPIVFKTDPDNPITLCGGVDISTVIRSDEVTSAVSRISAWPEVRAALLTLQRKIIDSAKNGIVVEGRDIGTVVAPFAQLKIWLEADINARAIRRDLEQQGMKIASSGTDQVAASLEARDAQDSSRPISPLKKAEDAIVVDSTNLTLNETVDYIWNVLKQRSLIGLPKVVIVGRPNVGKSTLVNRIIGSREAIIEDVPGVTRDRVSYEAEWNGKGFFVVDTGGWEPTAEGIALKISEAAESAIVDADLVLFVVDAQVGQQSDDDALISVLRKSKKPVMLIANKVDSEKDELEAHSLWNLGLGEPHFISAAHGRGSGDLLDEIVSRLPEVGQSRMDDGYRRIAIVGRPNVGKSSLLNSFAGSVRALVDDAEGTTRDPIDELIDLGDKTWRFIDTAGIRRRAHQASGSDYYAALRTERAIENAEVVIMVLDASVPITEQDLRIISLVEDSGKALVIGMNKWDLVDEDRRVVLDKETDRNFDQVEWAERVNISAKTGWHKDRLLPAIERALGSWEMRVPTARLNSFLGQLIGSNPPPIRGGKQPKILFATQAGIAPPTFVIFATEFLEASYRRFIERRLREEFGFSGSPIRVSVRIRER